MCVCVCVCVCVCCSCVHDCVYVCMYVHAHRSESIKGQSVVPPPHVFALATPLHALALATSLPPPLPLLTPKMLQVRVPRWFGCNFLQTCYFVILPLVALVCQFFQVANKNLWFLCNQKKCCIIS